MGKKKEVSQKKLCRNCLHAVLSTPDSIRAYCVKGRNRKGVSSFRCRRFEPKTILRRRVYELNKFLTGKPQTRVEAE